MNPVIIREINGDDTQLSHQPQIANTQIPITKGQ